ncbi:MAG: hypothetical protein Q8O54_11555 [Brevundimonas sp.]|nr:hypothetical protein [Brevundimonas sp.]
MKNFFIIGLLLERSTQTGWPALMAEGHVLAERDLNGVRQPAFIEVNSPSPVASDNPRRPREGGGAIGEICLHSPFSHRSEPGA